MEMSHRSNNTFQSWKLIKKCIQDEYQQWKSFHGFLGFIESVCWIDIWKEGIAPTQQMYSSLPDFFMLSRSLPNQCKQRERRISDEFYFLGTEKSVTMYDQQWYIKFSAVLLLSSIFILPLSILSSLYYRRLDGAILSSLVCLTSINHWKKPRRNWRRSLDIFVVRVSIAYHFLLAVQPDVLIPYGIYWLLLAGIVGILYISVRGLCRRLMNFEASLLHLCMHIVGVIGNTLIYNGLYQVTQCQKSIR